MPKTKHTQVSSSRSLKHNPFQNPRVRDYLRGPNCLACGQEIDLSKQPQGYVHWGAVCPEGYPRSEAKPTKNCTDAHEVITQNNAQAYEDGLGNYARDGVAYIFQVGA